jgi:hypothetical protein
MGYQTSQRLIKDRLDLIKNSEEIRFSIFRDWMNRWYSTLTFSVVKFKKKQPKSEIVAIEKKVFILKSRNFPLLDIQNKGKNF